MNKKRKVLICILTLCLLLAAVPAAVLAAGYSLLDIVQFARAMAGSADLTIAQQQAYDVNGDGKLDILDLALMAENVLKNTNQNTAGNTSVSTSPAVCSTCHQYPCICSGSQVCTVCGQYNCGGHYHGGHQTGAAVTAPAAWTCGTCHAYPCVCHSSSHHTTASTGTAAAAGHHGWGHH